MEKLTISAVSKPLFICSWFLILGCLPFLFPSRGIPYWTSVMFFFFALIIIFQLKKFGLSANEIEMNHLITGKKTIIQKAEIERISLGEMPLTMASRLGLMRRGKMVTILSKNKTKISIATPSTGHEKFAQLTKFLITNYPEFFMAN